MKVLYWCLWLCLWLILYCVLGNTIPSSACQIWQLRTIKTSLFEREGQNFVLKGINNKKPSFSLSFPSPCTLTFLTAVITTICNAVCILCVWWNLWCGCLKCIKQQVCSWVSLEVLISFHWPGLAQRSALKRLCFLPTGSQRNKHTNHSQPQQKPRTANGTLV